MRYLVVFLLVANIAFFVWYPRPAPQLSTSGVNVSLQSAGGSLTLLSERPQIEVTAETSGVEQQQPAVDEFPVELATADVLQADVTTAGEDVAGAEETVEEIQVREEEITMPEIVAEVKVFTPACYALGPLESGDSARSIQKKLSDEGFATATRSGEIKEPAGYMVFLPAMPADEAKRVVTDLRKHGVKDYFVGKKNFISLGIFSRKAKANIRQQQIADYGYEARLWDRFRTRTIFWVDVEEQGEPLEESLVWQDLRSEYPDLGMQQVSCE